MQIWITAGAVAVALAVVLVLALLVVAVVMCIGTFVDAGAFGAAIMLVVGLVLGVPLIYDETLHGLAGPLGVDLADVWGGALAYGLLGLACWLGAAVPMLLAAYAESFESVRTALRTALAANPAATPGGAEGCRGCGGPLEVPADRVHARCIYCGTDNLAHLDRTRLAKLEQDMQVVCSDLESAIEQERNTARVGRTRTASELVQWAALVPACILLGRCVAGLNEDDATFWHRAVPSTPMIPAQVENPRLPRGEATRFDVHKTFDDCDDVDCWAYYYVALAQGERPHIVVSGGDLRLVRTDARSIGPWYNPTYVWQAIDLDDAAPYSGWYRVKLATAKHLLAEPTVTWSPSRE